MTLSPPDARLSPPSASPLHLNGAVNTRVDASSGRRAGAYLIDVAIVAGVGLLVWLFTGSLLLVAVSMIELWVVAWIWEGHTGATPGNLICGIRTVQRGGLITVGAPRLLPRSLLMGLAHIIPVLLPLGLAASGALDGIARARAIDVRLVRGRGSTGSGPGGMPSLETRVSGTSAGAAAGEQLITRTPLGQSLAADAALVAPAPDASPAPSEAPYLPRGAATVPVLELGDATVIRVTGLGFIGRAPRAPESIPDAILVRVPDGARSLSRTHASFGVEEGELWVQDLGSANGASVRHLGGSVTDLRPHTPFFLVPGDVLILGGDAELAFRRVVDRSLPAPNTPAPVRESSASAMPVPSVQEQVVPEYAPAPAEPASALGTAVALQFQDGTTIPISGTGYIGRAPSRPDGERADAVLVAVPDGDRSVSRTHGRFGVVGDQTWFEDLGSGNGSTLRTSDGRSGPMTPHQRFGLVPGMVLQLGDCVIRIVAG